MTLGLELPNQLVIAIDGIVQQRVARSSGDATGTTWIEVELIGLHRGGAARASATMADGGAADDRGGASPRPRRRRRAEAHGRRRSRSTTLPADERELFQHLTGELRRLRAARGARGARRRASTPAPEEVRDGWKSLVRRHHPDLVARRNAPAITHLAEELTILSQPRVRPAARRARRRGARHASVGPTLAAPPGWLVGFDDISSGGTPSRRATRSRALRARCPTRQPTPRDARRAGRRRRSQGGEAFEHARARDARRRATPTTAREVLAAALVVYPRSKPLRSLYYVATALAALQKGELMLATSQLETALAHHEQCIEAAADARAHARSTAGRRSTQLQRLFK